MQREEPDKPFWRQHSLRSLKIDCETTAMKVRNSQDFCNISVRRPGKELVKENEALGERHRILLTTLRKS